MSARSSTGYARWCFKTDKGRFKSMGEAVNRCIEGVFSQTPRPSSFTVKSSGTTYFVDFDTMKQQNIDTKFVREIQRQFIDASTGTAVIATAGNSPLLLLPAPASVIAANASNTNVAAPAALPAQVSTMTAAALNKTKQQPSQSRVDPNSKRQQLFSAQQKAKDEMRARAKAAYDKIEASIKQLSPEDQGKVLARAIVKLNRPFKKSSFNPAIRRRANVDDEIQSEAYKLKKVLMTTSRSPSGREVRQQLGLNLARLMIGSGPQW